jgi:hypothetical protein
MFSEAYGEEAMKKSSVFEWHDGSKMVARTWNMTKEMAIQDFTEPMKMLKKCGCEAVRR